MFAVLTVVVVRGSVPMSFYAGYANSPTRREGVVDAVDCALRYPRDWLSQAQEQYFRSNYPTVSAKLLFRGSGVETGEACLYRVVEPFAVVRVVAIRQVAVRAGYGVQVEVVAVGVGELFLRFVVIRVPRFAVYYSVISQFCVFFSGLYLRFARVANAL